MIELRALGALNLTADDGSEIRSVVVQPKRMALLAYLAAAEPRGLHRRDSLLSLFWPGHDAEHARASLRQVLHGLRAAIGQHVMIARGDGEVGVDERTLWCDVSAFEDAIQNRDWKLAASLYRGPFLSDFHLSDCHEFERWVETERDRLSRHFERALEELAEAAEARGDLAQAVECWERVREYDPRSDRVVIRLMKALDRAGDRARAIDVARQHAEQVFDELGAAPNPEVEQLVERMRTRPELDSGEWRRLVSQTSRPASPARPAYRVTIGRVASVRSLGLVAWLVLTVAVIVALVFKAVLDGGSAEPDLPSLAVVWSGIEARPGESDIAAGIAEAIRIKLADLAGLRIIHVGDKLDDDIIQLPDLRKSFGIQHLLKVSAVARQGPTLERSVTASFELVRVPGGEMEWGDSYEVPWRAGEVFELESKIAARVAEALDIVLLARERGKLEQEPTYSLAAWDAFAQGNQFWNRSQTRDDVLRAIRMYERAVAIDSLFAPAHAMLGGSLSALYQLDPSERHLNRARAALDLARDLDPNAPLVRTQLALYYHVQRDYGRARGVLSGVLAERPNHVNASYYLGLVQRSQGEWDDALADLRRAAEHAPDNRSQVFNIALTNLWRRDHDAALEDVERAIRLAADVPNGYSAKAWLEVVSNGDIAAAEATLWEARDLVGSGPLLKQLALEPERDWFGLLNRSFREELKQFSLRALDVDSVYYYFSQAQAYLYDGATIRAKTFFDSTRVVLEQRLASRIRDSDAHALLGLTYAALGDSARAVRESQRAVELRPISMDAFWGPRCLEQLARTNVVLGQYDDAITQLEQLVTVPSQYSRWLLRVHPMFDPLRRHARFKRLIAGV
jgi:DNA-binding SARP family transcriptional activator